MMVKYLLINVPDCLGDRWRTVPEYFCDGCGRNSEPQYGNPLPYFTDSAGRDFCPDCALRNGLVSAMNWFELHGVVGILHHAEYKDRKVIGYQKHGRGFIKWICDLEPAHDAEER